jgi:hypothetical protein
MIFKYIFIYILIIIIFYIINKYILKNNINEHYLTYFLPYYDDKINSLTNFYRNNENNANYFKKKIDFRKINIGIIGEEVEFVEKLFKFYIYNSKVIKVNLIKYTNRMNIIHALYENKLTFCLSDYISIHHYYKNINTDIEHFRFITHLYKLYFYLFTKKQYNIFSYNDIRVGTKIGIINNDIYTPAIYFYSEFFNDMGYKENIDYIPIFYNNNNELYKGFENNECEIIFLIDIFPNNHVKYFIEKNINEDIILLPFDLLNEVEFLNKNKILKVDYIDLNNLSRLYFPKKFGNNTYTQNLPTLKILFTYKILLSTRLIDDVYTYNFIKFYNENINYINNNIKNGGYKLNIEIGTNHFIISDYHKGVRDYYFEKGYITYIDNNNCKYLVGKMECTEQTLKNNNLFK